MEPLRRKDVGKIKDELSSAMLHCIPSFEQSNKVMLAMIELMFEAIDSLNKLNHFKPTSIKNAFDVMDSCAPPTCDQQKVQFHFARAFVLFMDSVKGFCAPSRLQENEASQRIASTNADADARFPNIVSRMPMLLARPAPVNPVAISGPLKRPRILRTPTTQRIVVPSKYSRPAPVLKDVTSIEKQTWSATCMRDLSGMMELRQETTPMAMKAVPKDEPLEDEMNGMSSTPLFGSHSSSSRVVKEEEIDSYDFSNPATLDEWDANANESFEFKQELVKEEELPIEPPIHDTVKFGRSVSSHLLVPSATAQISTNQAPVLRLNVACPYCEEEIDHSKLEYHIKTKHKRVRMKLKYPNEEREANGMH